VNVALGYESCMQRNVPYLLPSHCGSKVQSLSLAHALYGAWEWFLIHYLSYSTAMTLSRDC
jgi:hypothetical protein